MLSLLLTCSLFVFWAILGRAILAVFIPRMLGVLRPWLLAPAVGFATLSIPVALLNQLGLPIKSFAWILTIGLLLGAGIALKLKKTLFPLKALLPILGALVFSLLWTAWPALKFSFNWVSIVNDDYCNYCLAAERFKDFGFYHVPSHSDFLGRDYAQYYWLMHAIGLMRFGSEHALAWVVSLVPLPAFEIFMPTIMGFALSQVCAATALVLMVGRRRRYAYWTAAFLVVSPMFLYGILYQLIAQVSGVSLLLTVVTLLTAQINTRKRGILIAYAIPVSIVGASLCIYYPEVTPFAALSISAYHFIKWVRNRCFPSIHVVLIQYSILGTVILLRYNFISYLYTLVNQFVGASRKVDLSLSMFPFFLVPTGLASVFGFQPMMGDISDPWASVIIILGFILLLICIFYAIKSSISIVPAAVLLGVELLMAAWLYRSGNDFGLYKMVMFMQPVLMASLVSSVLESRFKKYIAVIAVCYLGITAYTSLVYTRGSCGAGRGMVSEVGHASEFFAHRPTAPTAQAHWTSTIDNVSAAKLAAGLYRFTDMSFLSRDYFLNLLIITSDFPYLKFFPNYSQFSKAAEMVDLRQRNDFVTKKVFDTKFVEVHEYSPTTAFLNQAPQLSLFNKIHEFENGTDSLFSLDTFAKVRNRLLFIHSSRGNQYYLGDRHSISYFQQETDAFGTKAGFNGIGQFMLLRVENSSDEIFLRVQATKTIMGKALNRWSSEAVVMGENSVKLGAVGAGALNLFVGPIKPIKLDGVSYVAIDFKQPALPLPIRRTGLKALYNANISLDYRRLVAYGRDISALSKDELLELNRPRFISQFPEDLFKTKGLEYSGIYEDGWISKDSKVTLDGSTKGDYVRLKGFVPEMSNRAMKGSLSVAINGELPYKVSTKPGAFDLLLPIKQGHANTCIDLAFSEETYLEGDDGRSISAKIEYMGLFNKKDYSVDYTQQNTPKPPSDCINQDGWCGMNSEIILPIDTQSNTLLLKIEYPGWNTVPKEANITLCLNSNNPLTFTLKPGVNNISIPHTNGMSQAKLTIHSDVKFKLPAPDSRDVSFRLLSLMQ